MPVLLEVGERTLGRVDRELSEVGAPESLELCVEVGEVATLQQGVVGEVDPGDDVLGAERHLLRLREEVVDRPIEHEATDTPYRQHLLGDQLGRVEDVELEPIREAIVEHLHAELPLGEVT